MSNHSCNLDQVFKKSIKESIKAAEYCLELNQNIDQALDLLADSSHKPIVVCALGKSGYIAAKLAATLKSLDIKAEYLHASEALHGDLGSVGSHSLVILLSHSGETEEVVNVAQESSLRGAMCLGITAYPKSRLGLACHACLALPVSESVCRIGVAPMASTTVSLIICDSIANALAHEKEININSFRKNHPGGKLGKSLLPVSFNMKPINSALVGPDTGILDALSNMSGTGFVLVQSREPDEIVGIFTDGDLRRILELGLDVKKLNIGDYCSYDPVIVAMDMLSCEAETLMNKAGVTSVLVSNQNKSIVGVYRK